MVTQILSTQLLWVFVFTFLIHLIHVLSYSVRIVGVRTGRIAASIALFNILVLVARLSHALQLPLLAKKIELDIAADYSAAVEGEFRLLLLAATLGSFFGALISPTFRNLFTRYVNGFDQRRSVPKLLIHSFSKIGVQVFKDNAKAPSPQNIHYFRDLRRFPYKLLLLNASSVSILTVGSFAALYAGYVDPELRTTASSLASVVTGLATVVLLLFIDPKLSALTDDMLAGRASANYFYQCVVAMVVAHIVGTVLAQLFLLPAAQVIVFAARNI